MLLQVQWGDVATWVSGVATAIAVGFAGIQLLAFRRDAAHQDQVELKGVAVSWRAKEVPTGPDLDGTSTALYTFTVHNPGRMPITEVEVSITAPCELLRVHFDGSTEHLGEGFDLDTPVIAGGDKQSWDRRLRLRYDERQGMRELAAKIKFVSLKSGETHTNIWGRGRRPR
jgi:hypothetical protein